jgi:hypothetical protein
MLNQIERKSLEICRADAAGTASDLHEVITAFSRDNRTSDGIRAPSRPLAYETSTSPVAANAEM